MKLLGVGIQVQDRATGLTVLAAEHPARSQAAHVRRYPLRRAQPADLLPSEYAGEELDSLLLVHLVKILQVTVDRILTADLRAQRAARALLALRNGTIPPDLNELLAPFRAADGFQPAAFSSDHGERVARAVGLRRQTSRSSTGTASRRQVCEPLVDQALRESRCRRLTRGGTASPPREKVSIEPDRERCRDGARHCSAPPPPVRPSVTARSG